MKLQSVREAGFTVVEVMFFLAMSSVLIIAAASTVSGRTSQAQYTDGTRAVEAFFERKIREVETGSILADANCRHLGGSNYDDTTSDGTCIFLGYYFHVDEDAPRVIDVYLLLGERVESDDDCIVALSEADSALTCVNPALHPVDGTPAPIESFDIPWGGEVTARFAGDNTSEWVGFFRNPVGQNLIPVGLNGTNGPGVPNRNNFTQVFMHLEDPTTYEFTQPSDANNVGLIGANFEATYCLEISGRQSQISIGIEERQYAVDAFFDQRPSPLCT